MNFFKILGLFLIGIIETFMIQYSFKFQIVLYPILLTNIIFFLNGRFIHNKMGLSFILNYLIFAIPIISIQLYGLKVNFSGLKYLSPSLLFFSFLSFTIGYKYISLQKKLRVILSILLILTSVFMGYYLIPKIHYESTKKEPNKIVDLDCSLIDINGKRINLNQLKNKILFINFWDSNCGYCFEKLPYVEALQRKVKSEDIVFLEINPSEMDDYSKFKKTVEKHYQFQEIPTYFDEKSILAKKLGVSALPHQFIIDRNATIRNTYLGFNKDDKLFYVNDNFNYLEELLNEK